MTFNATVPNAAQSPGLFPGQMNTNLARLKTIIDADHVFNDTAPMAPNNDGAHKKMTMVAQATEPVAPLPNGTNGIMYNFVRGSRAPVYYFNGLNRYLVSNIMAAVNFNGTGAIGSIATASIRSSFNIKAFNATPGATGVEKTAVGSFTIRFDTNLPDTNYLVLITGMRNLAGAAMVASVLGDVTYGSSIAVSSVKVIFNALTNGALADPIMANVVVIGLT